MPVYFEMGYKNIRIHKIRLNKTVLPEDIIKAQLIALAVHYNLLQPEFTMTHELGVIMPSDHDPGLNKSLP